METIAAISTPLMTGGVSMIRISGDSALDVAKAVFFPKGGKDIDTMEGYTACYGEIRDEEGFIDDGVLLVYRAPHSYTGEDVAEITCHGGVFITQKVLSACFAAGASPAQAGEFTKRAVLNGKLTLTQAEAVMDAINAQSRQYLDFCNAQKSGALYKKLKKISDVVLSIVTEIAAWTDYPDEADDVDMTAKLSELKQGAASLKRLLEEFESGRLLREGVEVAIVGKPNAGKSTLMNILSGKTRSIVTSMAGTTRDIVEETVRMDNIVLKLSDCAGLRAGEDEAERIGVEMMLEKLEQAQLAYAVFDSSKPLEEEDFLLLERLKGKKVICIINKSDLPRMLDESMLQSRFDTMLYLSAKEDPETALTEITKATKDVLHLSEIDLSAGFLANERQKTCAKAALDNVTAAIEAIENGITADAVGVLAEQALANLYELTGDHVSDKVIDEIFRRFCVGK